MKSSPIYKRDAKGRVRLWMYEVEGNKWRTIAGLVDGEKVTSEWTVCEARSQPTGEKQALFEAEAETTKKLKKDYRRDLSDVDRKRKSTVSPMLCKDFADYEHKINYPVYVQPKLDGFRCIANKDGLWSRQGNKFISCPHIEEALRPLFGQNPDLVLDGELYNHELHDDFNEIGSLIKKTTNLNAEHLAKTSEMVQYHMYDLPSHLGNFVERFTELSALWKLRLASNHSIKLVETNTVGNREALDIIYDKYLADMYEGGIIRLNTPYEEKRSSNILKRKEWQDAEFPFLYFEEGSGNWAGYPKSVTCRLPNGGEVKANVTGSREKLMQLKGKTFHSVTIKYQGVTPDGSLRFPSTKAFWDKKRNV